MGEQGWLGPGRFAAAQVERHSKSQLPKHDGFAGVQPALNFRDHGQAVQRIYSYPGFPRPGGPGEPGLAGGDLRAV